MGKTKEFEAVVAEDARGRVYFSIPFEPDEVWGNKSRHHVTGTANGMRIRGVVEQAGSEHRVSLGAAWRRDCGIGPGDPVVVYLDTEGPQRGELAPDISEALDTDPAAADFFDSLARFYRKAYLRWIDSTKRRPDLRGSRIAEMVDLLKEGHKERPVR